MKHGNLKELKIALEDVIFFRYDITYTSAPNSCGGNVSGDHGVIFSRYYPQVYH